MTVTARAPHGLDHRLPRLSFHFRPHDRPGEEHGTVPDPHIMSEAP